jgi:hypothetical protein
MNVDQFTQFVEDARGYCRRTLEESRTRFGLGDYKRYELDLKKGTLRFFDSEGVERVAAAIQAAGSWSPSSQTWLWSWENDSVPEISRQRMIAVKDFGLAEDLPMLSASFGSCREVEAWAMAAVAGQILSSEGFYRIPGALNQLFLLLFSIRKCGPDPGRG